MPSSNWQKSSYSASSNECVEIRSMHSLVELRESDEAHLTLRTSPTALAALLHGAKTGEFNHHA
ncbi:DUF397 domain-containing protein [Kitasatospora sp. NPDC101183]|uniref:DUF397 domain-containing protein n=1 Tax=Kitasatospora sp. NPDC101183 TaxID=3364100 RepID=UPI0037F5A7AF